MPNAATHAQTMTCTLCGHEGPPSEFRPRRRGARLLQKCWICRYLAAKTPRARLDALPPSPFDLPAPSPPGGQHTLAATPPQRRRTSRGPSSRGLPRPREGKPRGAAEYPPAGVNPAGGASAPARDQERLTRTCRKCGVEKSLGDFYLDRSTGRRTSPCRRCIRAANRRYYAENRERLIPVRRRWAAQEDPEQRNARQRRCRERNRLKYAIRSRTNRLRVLGVLDLAPECADCGGPAADLHHESYGSVCALVSLCRRCHMARHYRVWRKHGGGPVKYPWEHDQEEEGSTAKNAKRRERRRRGDLTTDATDDTDEDKSGARVKPRDRKGQPRKTRNDAKEDEDGI